MAEVLFVLLLVLGVLGAVIFTLRRRGWMRNGYFTIGTSILIAFIVMLAYQSLAPILLLLFPGADTENTKLLLAMNALAQLVVLVGGSFLLIRATEQDANATLRLEGVKQTPIELYLLGPFIMLFTTIVSGAISQFWIKLLKPLPFYSELEKLQTMNEELITKLTSASNSFELLVVVLAVAIVPAIAEEVFFRGFLQTNIERSGNGRSRPYVALSIASVIFAGVHFSPFQFPGLLGLGLAMGYMTYRTNNLLVGSLAHAFNNGMFVLVGYYAGSMPDESKLAGELETFALLGALVIGSLALAGLLRLFHFWSEPIEARQYAEDEVQRATAYYTEQELSAYNERLLADFEDEDRKRSEDNTPNS